jgi:hypothetical protein
LLTFGVVTAALHLLLAAGTACCIDSFLAALPRGRCSDDRAEQALHEVVKLRPLVEAVLGDDDAVRRDDQPHVATNKQGRRFGPQQSPTVQCLMRSMRRITDH